MTTRQRNSDLERNLSSKKKKLNLHLQHVWFVIKINRRKYYAKENANIRFAISVLNKAFLIL